jgi:cell wall-associated NlpC family hydrolase
MRRLIAVLLASLAAGCATTGATPRPFPTPGTPAPSASELPRPEVVARDAYAISGTALTLRGIPYRNGGSDPSGFDCSGFVWYVFGQHGIQLPRTVTEQAQAGNLVEPSTLRAGDLVFFDTSGHAFGRRHATHVGISIGGEEFVHAPSTRGEVRVERLGSTYWSPRFLEARRVQ